MLMMNLVWKNLNVGEGNDCLSRETSAIPNTDAVEALCRMDEKLNGDDCSYKRFDISQDLLDHHFLGTHGQDFEELIKEHFRRRRYYIKEHLCRILKSLCRILNPKDLVYKYNKVHFRKRGYYILKAYDAIAYMNRHLIGSLADDASVSKENETGLTLVGFKLMLAKITPRLFSSLSEIGADCQEFKHLR